jgi:hypothetical protein
LGSKLLHRVEGWTLNYGVGHVVHATVRRHVHDSFDGLHDLSLEPSPKVLRARTK